MKSLCFAFLMSQNSKEALSPPLHIQNLIKNRILHQLKQEDLDLQIYFDNAQCEIIGSYEYQENSFVIFSKDQQQRANLEYSHIIEGSSLELGSIKQLVENKKNMEAVLKKEIVDEKTKKKTWIPWTLGAVLVGASSLFIHQLSSEKKEAPQRARRFR